VSVQFGIWNWDGRPTDRVHLEKVKTMLAPYGPDACGSYGDGNIGILSYGFHTTKESQRETQPHCTKSGAAIAWDGRLDNREYLLTRLRDVLTGDPTDLSLVAAAYETWGLECFAKLVGDWAISIWNPNDRSLILAKDPIGARHLYYRLDVNQATWSSLLDPLLLFSGNTFQLQEEYLAGWLACFSAPHLTPYIGIHAVPPSSLVKVQYGRQIVRQYWDFDSAKRIRYRDDAEYEEHFRCVFMQAVKRRLRSHCTVLAELSGGLDSSSIVCVADVLIANGAADAPRLDTVSYDDESEPNLNERPYFTRVEDKRGRTGRHISFSGRELFGRGLKSTKLAVLPGATFCNDQAAMEFADCVTSQGIRVVLSGIGGDEVTGGVPTPIPELQDLVVTCRIKELARQLELWALAKRRPWFHLLFEALKGFLPPAALLPSTRPAPWVNAAFAKRQYFALRGYENRIRLFSSLPSFQTNLSALDGVRRQIENNVPPVEPVFERRYPFLDRDLLEFMYAIPRHQVVRPGQRRSLVRRALVGIVPSEILNRRRKAFVARAPLAAISNEWGSLSEIKRNMVSASIGLVVEKSFSEFLHKACQGKPVPLVQLMRTLYLELWLRNLSTNGILADVASRATAPPGFVASAALSAEKN
jgi:asparagine synthase (glutamine-hydrolysing)